MIYFKLNNKVYSGEFFPIVKQNYSRYYALYRILKSTLEKELKDFPEIDIVLTNKQIKRKLGVFYHNEEGFFRDRKQFDFIPQHSGNPYIVLHCYLILDYYKQHPIKGFLSILFHEYGHYKEWLLNQSYRHTKRHRATADKNAELHLKEAIDYLTIK